jgi:hypothetical protein
LNENQYNREGNDGLILNDNCNAKSIIWQSC